MDEVVITGVGVVSPLGTSPQALARSVASGVVTTGAVASIPLDVVPAEKRARIGRLDRLCRMFLSASYLAVDSAALAFGEDESERIGLSFGTGFGCLLTNAEYYEKVVEHGPSAASPRLFAYTVSSAAAGEVSIALGIRGPNVTAHMGFAAGLGAVGYGVDLIQMDKADVVLAGGADVIGPALLDGLRAMGLLKDRARAEPFRDAVPGVSPSEGAAVVVLERAQRARARGARVWGRLDGYAAGFEPTLTRSTPEPTGLVATMQRALQLGGRQADDVGLVMTSAHGTPIDPIERAAIDLVIGNTAQVFSLKACLGETFAASGVLALCLAAADSSPVRRDAAVVLVNAVCYSGNIVSLLLTGVEGLRE